MVISFVACPPARNIGQGGMDIQSIAAEISTEIASFNGGETLANSLRCAAQMIHEDDPTVTAAQFGDAAATVTGPNGCKLHRQAAMNRWNEAKANCGDEW